MHRRYRRGASRGIFPRRCRLLADVALRPSFPAEEVERIRATRLADLVQQRSNPTSVASVVAGGAVRHASIWIHRARNGRVHQAADARRSPGVLAAAFRSRQRRARRRRLDYGSRAAKARGDDIRQLAARHRHACEARRADGRATASGDRRSSGLAADAAPCRDVRRAAHRAPTTCRCA